MLPKESRRDFVVVIHNRSRSHVDLTLRVSPPDESLSFQFDWERVVLASGGTAEAGLVVEAGPELRTGTRYQFGVAAISDGEVVATAPGTFQIPGRTIRHSMSMILLSMLGITAIVSLGAAMLCPTVLRKVCPSTIPDNLFSGIVASPTVGLSVLPTPSLIVSSPSVMFTMIETPSPKPIATMVAPTVIPSETNSPYFVSDSNVLIYTVEGERGVSLVAMTVLGEPITFVADVEDVMVLDYTPADGGKVAVRVINDGTETLWIISSDGTLIRSGIYQGWLSINDAVWSPDGGWLVLEADIPGLTTYYIYDGIDGALMSQPPLFPRTQTATFTNIPTQTEQDTNSNPDAMSSLDIFTPTESTASSS